MIKQKENIDKKSLTRENEKNLAEDDFGIEESSVMITSGSSGNTVVNRLQEQINQLQQEKESLEIDNVCLKQRNHELKNRIDDVATHFPKTSILLGKKPKKVRGKGFKITLKKNK